MKKNFLNKCRKVLADELMVGEEIVQSVLGEPEGSLLQNMSDGKRLGLAAWDAKKARDSQDPDALAVQVSRKRQMITLTNMRVLFHSTSATAKPTKLTFEFPVNQVELKAARANRKNYVLVGFPDDSTKSFLCHHNQPIDRMGEVIELT